jgi:XRE family transcriptional regulator, regulator of sulfur utilization
MPTKREANELETAEQRVGPALKRLRESAGLSLRTLAEQIGFSASFISQAENGVVSPSIASLEKMASALGVTLADLFSVEPTTEGAVVRAHARPNFRSAWSKARIDALMPSGGSRTLEALMVMLEGGGSSGKHQTASRVDQFAIVWEGSLMLTHAGEEIELNTGDSVLVRAKTQHRWHNPGSEAARILIISSRVT